MKIAQWLAALLVALHVCLAGAYSFWNPLGEAPDEADHWAYVIYLANERRLPEGPKVTQSKHPPLYHSGAAVLTLFAEPNNNFLRANPDVAISPGPTQSANFFVHTALEAWPWQGGVAAMHLARLWSLLLSTGTVAATFGLARAVLPQRPGVVLLATGLTATLPEFAFIGATVSNDGAAAFFSTLALWGAVAMFRAGGRIQAGWWTPLALGFGLLTKVSTVALWPVVGLALLLGATRPTDVQQRRQVDVWFGRLLATWPRWTVGGGILFVVALIPASPWLVRNWRLYGDPTGMALVRQTIDLRLTPWGWSESLWLLQGWFISFWGKFGGAGHLPFPTWIYWAIGSMVAIAAVGIVRVWRQEASLRILLTLMITAILLVAAGVWRYSLIALGTDQGRLLFPALGPLLILFALGLSAWPWRGMGVALGTGLVVLYAGLALYGLFGVIRPAFAPPPPPTQEEVIAAAIEPLVWAEELALIGVRLDDDVLVYWQAVRAPTHDWRTQLRVYAADGSLVWEKRRSPGYGRYSTDRWANGDIISDRYIVQWPDWAGPGNYLVEVGLAPYGTDSPGNLPVVPLGTLERR